MEQHLRSAAPPPLRLVALAAVRDGGMLFVLPQPTRRRAENGYTLIPLGLPGGLAREDEPDDVALKRAVRAQVWLDCLLLASAWTYTPSPRHVVDRHAITSGQLAPLAETLRTWPHTDQ